MKLSKEEAQKLLDAGEITRSQFEDWTAEPREKKVQVSNTGYRHRYGQGRPYSPYRSDGRRTAIIFSEFIPENTNLTINEEHNLIATFLGFDNGNRFEFHGKEFVLTDLCKYLRETYGTDMDGDFYTADGIYPGQEWDRKYPKRITS